MINLSRRILLERLGRRGMMLTLMGLTYILLGVGVIDRPNPLIDDAYHLVVPRDIRGALWIASGLIACIFAWRRRDALGWSVLYVMPFIRITSYFGSWLCFLVDGTGYENAWYTAMLHLPFVLVTLICSGWRERETPPSANAEGGP